MTQVAKLVLADAEGNLLMTYRSNHPHFGTDPDLPGGTSEKGEKAIDTMVREVFEETGVTIDITLARKLYSGTDYSTHGTTYVLYEAKVDVRPEIHLSWEHSSYEWLDRAVFLQRAKNANDIYMHMVHDKLLADEKAET